AETETVAEIEDEPAAAFDDVTLGAKPTVVPRDVAQEDPVATSQIQAESPTPTRHARSPRGTAIFATVALVGALSLGLIFLWLPMQTTRKAPTQTTWKAPTQTMRKSPAPAAQKTLASPPERILPKTKVTPHKIAGHVTTRPKTHPAAATQPNPTAQTIPPHLASALAKHYPRRDPRRTLQRAIAAVTDHHPHRAVQLGHRALTKLRRRRALHKDHLTLLVHLGTVLSHGPRWSIARAQDFLFEAVRRPNAPLAAYLNLGHVYTSLQDSARAVWCFRQAVKRTPRDAIAHLELGRALLMKRRWHGMARRTLRRFIALAPNHPKVPWARRHLR
ncbi:MAG: hypothetical protein KAI47_05780, partial [Deltaproteobacteria bacterium]|nr:hypothetical protein [Deltaproteobacteria bacterium]